MAGEQNPGPLTGQRRLESLYAKYEGKYLMLFVFLPAVTITVIMVVLFGVIAPAMAKKDSQARADLNALAQKANLYRDARGEFPVSMDELMDFSHAHWAERRNKPSRIDPWEQEYYYFRISDERAALVSSGPNRTLDLDLNDLSPPSQDAEQFIRPRGDGIFAYYAGSDDWVVLAGSWPLRES
jgi:hypothetical protein